MSQDLNSTVIKEFEMNVDDEIQKIKKDSEDTCNRIRLLYDLVLEIMEPVLKMPIKDLINKYDGDVDKAIMAYCSCKKSFSLSSISKDLDNINNKKQNMPKSRSYNTPKTKVGGHIYKNKTTNTSPPSLTKNGKTISSYASPPSLTKKGKTISSHTPQPRKTKAGISQFASPPSLTKKGKTMSSYSSSPIQTKEEKTTSSHTPPPRKTKVRKEISPHASLPSLTKGGISQFTSPPRKIKDRISPNTSPTSIIKGKKVNSPTNITITTKWK